MDRQDYSSVESQSISNVVLPLSQEDCGKMIGDIFFELPLIIAGSRKNQNFDIVEAEECDYDIAAKLIISAMQDCDDQVGLPSLTSFQNEVFLSASGNLRFALLRNGIKKFSLEQQNAILNTMAIKIKSGVSEDSKSTMPIMIEHFNELIMKYLIILPQAIDTASLVECALLDCLLLTVNRVIANTGAITAMADGVVGGSESAGDLARLSESGQIGYSAAVTDLSKTVGGKSADLLRTDVGNDGKNGDSAGWLASGCAVMADDILPTYEKHEAMHGKKAGDSLPSYDQHIQIQKNQSGQIGYSAADLSNEKRHNELLRQMEDCLLAIMQDRLGSVLLNYAYELIIPKIYPKFSPSEVIALAAKTKVNPRHLAKLLVAAEITEQEVIAHVKARKWSKRANHYLVAPQQSAAMVQTSQLLGGTTAELSCKIDWQLMSTNMMRKDLHSSEESESHVFMPYCVVNLLIKLLMHNEKLKTHAPQLLQQCFRYVIALNNKCIKRNDQNPSEEDYQKYFLFIRYLNNCLFAGIQGIECKNSRYGNEYIKYCDAWDQFFMNGLRENYQMHKNPELENFLENFFLSCLTSGIINMDEMLSLISSYDEQYRQYDLKVQGLYRQIFPADKIAKIKGQLIELILGGAIPLGRHTADQVMQFSFLECFSLIEAKLQVIGGLPVFKDLSDKEFENQTFFATMLKRNTVLEKMMQLICSCLDRMEVIGTSGEFDMGRTYFQHGQKHIRQDGTLPEIGHTFKNKTIKKYEVKTLKDVQDFCNNFKKMFSPMIDEIKNLRYEFLVSDPFQSVDVGATVFAAEADVARTNALLESNRVTPSYFLPQSESYLSDARNDLPICFEEVIGRLKTGTTDSTNRALKPDHRNAARKPDTLRHVASVSKSSQDCLLSGTDAASCEDVVRDLSASASNTSLGKYAEAISRHAGGNVAAKTLIDGSAGAALSAVCPPAVKEQSVVNGSGDTIIDSIDSGLNLRDANLTSPSSSVNNITAIKDVDIAAGRVNAAGAIRVCCSIL